MTIQAQLIVGEVQVIKSQAPEGMLAAVFEDDGQTGYFYTLDESVEGNPIQDAVHIYNVEDISDGHIPSDIKIGWSEDGQKCTLLINGYPHGMFDFVGNIVRWLDCQLANTFLQSSPKQTDHDPRKPMRKSTINKGLRTRIGSAL